MVFVMHVHLHYSIGQQRQSTRAVKPHSLELISTASNLLVHTSKDDIGLNTKCIACNRFHATNAFTRMSYLPNQANIRMDIHVTKTWGHVRDITHGISTRS